MSKLALVTPEGVIMSDETMLEVETVVEEPLYVIAARNAAKQSTKIKETK